MLSLAAPPAPPPRRQVLVGTALAGVAVVMLFGGMLAVWTLLRERALDAEQPWLPSGVIVPEVPVNTMLISIFGLLVFAQWAVYAARRGDKAHTGLALGLVGLVGVGVINAQAYVYNQMGVSIAENGYGGIFYAVTGTMTALLIVGLLFTAITAFRYLGGRTADREIVAAHALYWYVLAVVFTAVWFVVYVTK